MSEVGAQGDPCTTIIFWSVAHPHVLYSASNPVPLTKYSILHNGISVVWFHRSVYLHDEILDFM
jgi:hypothetical protein